MFTVDRKQKRTMLAYRPHEQLAGHDQHFLVGQQDLLARPHCGQRRFESGGADNGRHHRIDLGMGRHLAQRVDPVAHRGRQVGMAAAQRELVRQRRIAHDGELRGKLANLPEKLFDLAVRAQREDRETLAVTT